MEGVTLLVKQLVRDRPFAGAFSPVAGNGYSSPLEIIFVNVIVVSDGCDLVELRRDFSKQDPRREIGANRKVPLAAFHLLKV